MKVISNTSEQESRNGARFAERTDRSHRAEKFALSLVADTGRALVTPTKSEPRKYFVIPKDGRFLVAYESHFPGNYNVVEDCRTEKFAQQVADNYNSTQRK